MTKQRTKPLRFTHLCLENWRNFTQVDVALQRRVFVIGPNESGKSNLLDVFRFLHDIATTEGGFQAAVSKPVRGGVAKLHCLAARRHTDIGIRVCVGDDKHPSRWEYELRFNQATYSLPAIKRERVVKHGREILKRPNEQDRKDPQRLTQTHLEQVSANQEFRELVEFFASVRYLHIVPQVLRGLLYSAASDDPFGGSFLKTVADLPDDLRNERLSFIRDALRSAVPNLKELEFWFDPTERRPHLRAEYEPMPGAWLLEDQLSDGTLRLIGMLWALLDGQGPLLLEEPELSLHPAIVRYLPGAFARLGGRERRQVFASTHSPDLLHDEGIGLNEVLLLQPGPEGTKVSPAKEVGQIHTLVEAGMSLEEAVLPHTSPPEVQGIVLAGT